MDLVWSVRLTGNPRFPARVAIERAGAPIFAVRAQDAWPGSKGNVFCVRDSSEREDWKDLPETERVPVLAYESLGRRIAVVLDRPTRKRCEFLILERAYKGRPGSYEQIFFKTQAASESHKSRSRVGLPVLAGPMRVVIDTAERYPWKFPKADSERRKLPAGDYALLEGESILAVVERKTFDNILSDFGRIGPLHQTLRELEAMAHPALVIEAYYGDFMNQKRLKGRWPPSHGYRLMAELQALHPALPIVFAGTRKEANLWTFGYFRAILKRRNLEREGSGAAAEALPPYGPKPREEGGSRLKRLEEAVLEALASTPDGLGISKLGGLFPDADRKRLLSALGALKAHGLADCVGKGRAACWRRA
jgi:hypothetical protein